MEEIMREATSHVEIQLIGGQLVGGQGHRNDKLHVCDQYLEIHLSYCRPIYSTNDGH